MLITTLRRTRALRRVRREAARRGRDEGGRVRHRRPCASMVASLAAGVRKLALKRMTALRTARSSPPSVAPRPRVAARSSRGGASLPAMTGRLSDGRETLIQPRRQCSSGAEGGLLGFGPRAGVSRAAAKRIELPSRCARALRRVRRWAARGWRRRRRAGVRCETVVPSALAVLLRRLPRTTRVARRAIRFARPER